MSPTQQQTHLSELAIDRLVAGELAAAEAGAARAHTATCAHCGGLYDDALSAREVFDAARPKLKLPLPIAARTRPLYARSALGAVAALAAAVTLVIVWPRAPRAPDDAPTADHGDTVRAKGTAIAGFFVAHGADVRRGATHETVVPGDRVELFTTTTAPAWFAAISEDATGTRSVYVSPREVAPGREQVLPMSIELDAALGSEVVSAVFCAHAFEPAGFDLHAPPADCTVDRFTLTKVPR